MKRYLNDRKKIAYYMRRLCREQYVTAMHGNISQRMEKGRFLITAAQVDNERIKETDVVLVDFYGNSLNEDLILSPETAMHLAVYLSCPHANVVISAHPVFLSAFVASHQQLNTAVFDKAKLLLDDPKYIPYHAGTLELAEVVADSAKETNVVLIENYGVVVLGETLLDAFSRIEMLERCAKTIILSTCLGGICPLSTEQQQRLNDIESRVE